MGGQLAYHDGLNAEESVARHYHAAGHDILARRWCSRAGEIDLITRKDGNVIFVEVKKSRNFARAAESLRPRQIARIYASAEAFLGGEPEGLNTAARFDVALVNAKGEISILENAICA